MFSKENPIQYYFDIISNSLIKKLNEYPIEQLIEYNDQELSNYFIENYKIEPIVYNLSNKSKTMIEANFEEYYQKDDERKFKFSIPVIKGDINLLFYSPNGEIIHLDTPPKATYEINDNANCIVVTFSIANHTLVDITDNKINEYIESRFSQESIRLFNMINLLNKDIVNFNDGLISIAKNNIELRKKDFDLTNKIIKNAGIELIPTNQMSKTGKKICLKPKIQKNPPKFPDKITVEDEYSLDDAQYKMIMNYIYSFLCSTEIYPQTMKKLKEDDIRNIILWSLNTNFGIATGETFRKNGKTDICINFKNKEAFIAECKIWKGEKALLDAIDQLNGYSTWKDVRTALLFFNKDRINFDRTIKTLINSIKKHDRYLSMRKIKKNHIECKFKNKLGNNPVIISFIISNYYLENDMKMQ